MNLNLEMWHKKDIERQQRQTELKQVKQWLHGCDDCAIADTCYYYSKGGGNDICRKEAKTSKKEPGQLTLETDCDSEEYRRTLQRLGREVAKTRLLQDIMADMAVCDIEGWDKLEYLRELKILVDGFLEGK